MESNDTPLFYNALTYTYLPLVVLLVLYKWKEMLYSFPVLLFIVQLLKFSTHKLRPDGSDQYSFPSGHTAVAWYLVVMYDWHPLLFIWAVLISISRVVQKRHDALDVTVGAILGVLVPYLRLKG